MLRDDTFPAGLTPVQSMTVTESTASIGRQYATLRSDEDSDQDLVDIQVEKAIVSSLQGRRREFNEWLGQWGIDYAARVREDHALFVDAFREGGMGIAST